MVSLDEKQQKKSEIMASLSKAVKEQDDTAMQSAMEEWCEFTTANIIDAANDIVSTADKNILATRGLRQLTSEETKYYNSMISRMKAEEKTITGLDEHGVMPETIFNGVLDDMRENHELLSVIDFKNVSYLSSWIYNKDGIQASTWGAVNSSFVTELEGQIGTFSTTLYKLTSFMFVSKDMLFLGPQWIDRYIRETLSEANAVGLETGIVDGTGNDMPIGMTREVGDDVTVSAGVYPEKEPFAITSLDKVTYGTILAKLTKTPTGRSRVIPVNGLIAICNPTDYFSKVMPATTLQLLDGSYKNNVLPYPTKIIQSIACPEGKMIIGLAKRYFAGLGTSKTGKIEYDDSFKFLDDLRTYTIRLYGTGRPLDNNAFVVLDISNLEDVNPIITTKMYNETRLASLAIGNIQLSPKFDKNNIYYTATTTSATNTVNAVAKDIESAISITNNNSKIENGTAVTWKDGLNTLVITVSNGGEARIYTVMVSKE